MAAHSELILIFDLRVQLEAMSMSDVLLPATSRLLPVTTIGYSTAKAQTRRRRPEING